MLKDIKSFQVISDDEVKVIFYSGVMGVIKGKEPKVILTKIVEEI